MILVTGGFGFVGAHTSEALLASGHECIATRRSRSSAPLPALNAAPGLTVEELDVTDWNQWQAIGERHTITGIIHLAAAPIDEPPARQVTQNLAGLLNAIRAAQTWHVARVIVASSIGVYAGVDSSGPLAEDLPLPPLGLHGIQASKKIGEITADLLSRSSTPQIISARLPAIWGPLGHPESRFFALPGLVHAAVAGKPRNVAAGSAIDALYVPDVARALVALMTAETLPHSIYNVGSGRATTAEDTIAALQAYIPDAYLTLEETSAAPPIILDVSRLYRDTDYRPLYDLSQGIDDYIHWLRAGHTR